jgi:hypothetical protein
MSQPVKISDSLVLDARLAGEVFQRSIAGQVEYWARLGRSVEDFLDGRHVRMLAQTQTAKPLSELVATIGTPEGQQRIDNHLRTLPFPHYAAHPAQAGLLIRTEENGARTIGRFVNRQFVVDENAHLPTAQNEERPTELARP